MTVQRNVILEELQAVGSHPTADEVYEMVRKRLPRISLGTVYRNLDKMSEAGVVQRIRSSDQVKRFDGNPVPHVHIQCVRCGRVDDLAMHDVMEDALDHASKLSDYDVTGCSLLFLGVCPACRDVGE
jgi:Fur family ferric uptake transcriptional regulator